MHCKCPRDHGDSSNSSIPNSEAAEVLRAVMRHERDDARKTRELAFDVLIALTARGIGATLITANTSIIVA